MSYWTVAQLKPQGTRLALHCLTLAGYEIYLPRLRERRFVRGRRVDTEAPLFPGYAFVVVELQWHSARWAPGVIRLVMDGMQPARVPDGVIDAIKARERNGAVELPKREFVPGDRIRIVEGVFRDHLGLYAGQTGASVSSSCSICSAVGAGSCC